MNQFKCSRKQTASRFKALQSFLKAQKRVQEQQYQQRQYDPAELDAIPADLLEQAQGG